MKKMLHLLAEAWNLPLVQRKQAHEGHGDGDRFWVDPHLSALGAPEPICRRLEASSGLDAFWAFAVDKQGSPSRWTRHADTSSFLSCHAWGLSDGACDDILAKCAPHGAWVSQQLGVQWPVQ